MADAAAFELLAALVPHLRRAVLIGNVVERKSAEAQGLSDLLDHIRAGVFVVDARGNLIYSNKAGQDILSEGDYLRATAGKLSARESGADQLLKEAFRATGDGDAAISSKSIAIPLMAADGTRRVANLLPLTRRRIAGIDETATAAVFVHKAALELPNPPEVIADAYRLTKAELRVLLALMELGGGPQIAEALGIGTGTVKTHLRNLFQKTGVKHQADLVKLVAGFSRSMVG
jgi:DNA-binding CsgD family transcriptional regulator